MSGLPYDRDTPTEVLIAADVLLGELRDSEALGQHPHWQPRISHVRRKILDQVIADARRFGGREQP